MAVRRGRAQLIEVHIEGWGTYEGGGVVCASMSGWMCGDKFP
jgi:hypothetical protein